MGTRRNDMLADVVERFLEHRALVGHQNPLIDSSARMACSIDLWKMWALTQE